MAQRNRNTLANSRELYKQYQEPSASSVRDRSSMGDYGIHNYENRTSGDFGNRVAAGGTRDYTSRASTGDYGKRAPMTTSAGNYNSNKLSGDYGNHVAVGDHSSSGSNNTRQSPSRDYADSHQYRSTVSAERFNRRSESPYSHSSRDSMSPSKIEDPTAKFEKGRIAVLQQERIHIQKKTFTKWCNSFLEKAHMQINDLFTDLADGKMLMKLLEIISGETVGRPNKGVLRVQKCENVDRCLKFLASKVQFENIGAEDIVDGSPRLILGLIWTIILRFQIQEIEIELDEEDDSSEKRSAKDALLLWCQRKTHGYPHVKIDNFSTSWCTGMGFNALLHAHKPEMINYNALNPEEHISNLNNAFNVAENKLGISRLLDAEDVDVPRPDDKSIMTYVAAYYHYFAKMKSEKTGTKRVQKVVGGLVEIQQMKDDYETLVSSLLDWIQQKVVSLNDHRFPNSLDGIQGEMVKFKDYRVVEKPPKYRERGNIEMHFFNIQAKLKANGRRMYTPPEGKLIRDIESAWTVLERAEHDRELALREELVRQERLEMLAKKFERKAGLRESWTNDMTAVLSDQNFGSNTTQVEAALKKHEAIAAEIETRKDRFEALSVMAQELVQENYHATPKVKKREEEIMEKWRHLMELLEKKRRALGGFNELLGMFREIESIQVEMKDMEPSMRSEETGKHLLSAQDLLQKHALQEAQVSSLGGRVRHLNKKAQPHMKSLHPESQLLQKRLELLNKDYDNINNLCKQRKALLEESHKYYQFLQDSEEEEAWLVEKCRAMKSPDVGKDITTCRVLMKKHEGLEREMQARHPYTEKICQEGEELMSNKHPSSRDIKLRINSLRDKWNKLRELAKKRRTRLEDAAESHQYYADCNEAESWITEKMPLVCSDDFGKDEATAKSLLQRHNHLEEEIRAFQSDISRLDQLQMLMTKAASDHKMTPEAAAKVQHTLNVANLDRVDGNDVDTESDEEVVVEVPHTYEVEELRQKEVMKEEIVERKIPQVKSMYPFSGQGIELGKGEVLILLQKTNSDWWSVRKAEGTEGYVPANYVKEIDPKIIQKKVKVPGKVQEKVIVTKTEMKKEVVKKKKPKSSLRRTPSDVHSDQDNIDQRIMQPSVRSKANLHFDKENVEQRQKTVNGAYNRLNNLAEQRHHNLEDAIIFYRFCRECDSFEKWMDDKEQILQTKESLSENMEAVKRRFAALITDLAANGHVIDDINGMADNMIKSDHSQQAFVKQRQKEMNDKWSNLNRLKREKEKNLEGASSIEIFQNLCGELKDWIHEKNGEVDNTDLGRDLDSVKALQRKHQNLEHELEPLEDKLRKMNLLANAVKKDYPDEAGHVNQREREIVDMWDDLRRKADERNKQLADAAEQQRFKEEARDLVKEMAEGTHPDLDNFKEITKDLQNNQMAHSIPENWVADVKSRLNEKQTPHDVAEAESLLKNHRDLKDEIDNNRDKFRKLEELANKILAKDPNNKEVRDQLARLKEDQAALEEMWEQKNKDLIDAKDLQALLREADQIDSVTASHEAFLEFDDLGDSVDAVENLLKRHEDFQNTLNAQDKTVQDLDSMADKLVSRGHPDSKQIEKRRKEVIDRRNRVKGKCQDRYDKLLAAKAFEEFNRDTDELSDWIKEKYQTATDESYRDLTNLLPKLQKHQAFEAELKANNDRLAEINQIGHVMIENQHYEAPAIDSTLTKLNSEWADLNEKALDKGKKLRQAAQQELFNKALEDANAKLKEMEKLVSSDDVGKDLRGVRRLLKQHQLLEKEMDANAENLKSIEQQGREMARAGHFDSAGILKAVEDFDKRFNALQDPMAKRRRKLEDSLKWHQYNFDANGELQWIKEHMPGATSTEYGKNLVDTQNRHAKHKKFDVEVQGHQPAIERVLNTGDALVKARHFASPDIKEKQAEVKEDWQTLLDHSAERKNKLDVSLAKQKYLSEVNDVETWINEKMQLVSSADYGKDENASDKLLTKHKAIEGDLITYKKVVNNDLGKEAKHLTKIDPDNAKDITAKQTSLENQIDQLEQACANRRWKLESAKDFHEYIRESAEFEEWIGGQMQVASSEDFGQDFEHVQGIQNKFNEFQLGIEAGSERFTRVDNHATQLIDKKNPNSTVVLDKRDQLREAWNDLLDQVETRSQKLTGANEIHRFNRDVEEALSRIQEKYASIPEDLGRDLRAVQQYQKSHEAFENELVALEAQLQVLIDDSQRLQETYPGGNAEQIAQQQAVVVENWNILQEKAAQRKDDLQAAEDLYRFLAAARDLMSWSDGILTELQTEEHARGVSTVDLLKKRHEELRAEIDARDDTFTSVAETGNAMISAGHYDSSNIQDTVAKLVDTQGKLRKTWDEKKAYLDQLHDQQVFYRDANTLEQLSNSQEAQLKGSDMGETVDQVERLIKRHEAFENLITTQNSKLQNMQDFGDKLLKQSHFDSKAIAETIETVTERRENVKALTEERGTNLQNSLLYTQFNRDCLEAEGWIDDKLKIATEEKFSGLSDLHDKMRKLQKHQAFESEIMANAPRIKEVKDKGEELIRRRHNDSSQIQKRVNDLIHKWNDLIQASTERGKGLEEAKDILKFNEEVDKVKTWIRDKEMLVAAGDTGRDYEHCLELQKKVNDVEGEVVVDDARIKGINQLADKLIHVGRTDTHAIKETKDALNDKWNNIQGALADHRNNLSTALEVHAFNRDVDDINERINEKSFMMMPQSSPVKKKALQRARSETDLISPKLTLRSVSETDLASDSTPYDDAFIAEENNMVATAVSTDDYGKDLAAVQTLQRKQDEVERDMTALHSQLGKLQGQSGKLCKKYPHMGTPIQEKTSEAEGNWEKLEDLAQARKLKLEESYQLHRFLTQTKEHIQWCNNLSTAITSGDLAKDVLEAEEQLEVHQERKAEIDGRYNHYLKLRDYGEKLLSQNHFASEDIQHTVQQLDKVWTQLNEVWEDRKQLLTQCYDLQVYEEYAEQADTWLASKEAFLANEDLGNTISSVDELMKKHEGFEKTLEAQEEKITTLEQLAQALLAQDHYATQHIKTRCDGVLERRDKLKEDAVQRRNKLHESKSYQEFLGNVYEMKGWIHDKHQVAGDESFNDPTNLSGKIQKHQAFEAELSANKRRVDAVDAEGNELISRNHFASKDVKDKQEMLQQSWDSLVEASQDKSVKLAQAYQALQFERHAEELEQWMDDVETNLASEDHGKDITTANMLLKKHQLLKEDIAKHQDKVTEIKKSARKYADDGNFKAPDMEERAANITDRYNTLSEPCQIRHDNLEDALLLYQFYRDVQDEMSWIHEKLPIAGSDDLGKNLTAVQNLQKKHQALESEIVSHEPLIEKVANTAHLMVAKSHYASSDVQTRLDELQAELQQLKDLAVARREKLRDSVDSQTFYSEVGEAESWISEKTPQVTNPDVGKDEDSAQALLKKLDAVELEVDSFSNNIGELAALSQGLIEREHFDSENIAKQQASIEGKYKHLREQTEQRRHQLVENKELYEYFRVAEQVEKWIKEQEVIASSEDYGTDLEHVQVLQKRFDEFIRDLNNSEERVSTISTMSQTLTSQGHRESTAIQKRCDEINSQWVEVKDIAQARQEALAGAEMVHAFVRDADDAIEWIQEKDVWVSSQDYGHDLESVRALIAKHDGFEQDLAAISEQVESITKEAERLLSLFPDAQEHIATKHEEMVHAWNALLEKAHTRKDKLQAAENLQMYFNDYRDLKAWGTKAESESNMILEAVDHHHQGAWCNEMTAIITSDELAKDVSSAEALINRHKEHKAEIDTRRKDFSRFTQRGKALIADKHFLSNEIQDKIDDLNQSLDRLVDTWEKRQTLYEQSLDVLQLRRDMDQLDTWLNFREGNLTGDLGDSIDIVEELIRKHDDFEQTVLAQEGKFNDIKRLTLLEQAMTNLKREEEQARLEEQKRAEKGRQEEMKRREQDRILQERKREELEKQPVQMDESMERQREEELRKNQEMLQKRRHDIEEAERVELVEKERINREQALLRIHQEPEAVVSQRSTPVRQQQQPPASPLGSPETTQKSTGLKPSEGWKDAPAKKITRTDSQKKEKRQRTLSLKTRKQTSGSFKEKYKNPGGLPPADIEGMLDRKQELQSGGKKATIRSWKYYHTVLCGQLLCFFKDKQSYEENIAAAPPIVIHNARCEAATDYTKKKHVLRLHLADGSEYLFVANNQSEMMEWVEKIRFHASLDPDPELLPPAQQLTQYNPELAQRLPQDSPPQQRGEQQSADTSSSPRTPTQHRQPPPPPHSTSPSSSRSSATSDPRLTPRGGDLTRDLTPRHDGSILSPPQQQQQTHVVVPEESQLDSSCTIPAVMKDSGIEVQENKRLSSGGSSQEGHSPRQETSPRSQHSGVPPIPPRPAKRASKSNNKKDIAQAPQAHHVPVHYEDRHADNNQQYRVVVAERILPPPPPIPASRVVDNGGVVSDEGLPPLPASIPPEWAAQANRRESEDDRTPKQRPEKREGTTPPSQPPPQPPVNGEHWGRGPPSGAPPPRPISMSSGAQRPVSMAATLPAGVQPNYSQEQTVEVPVADPNLQRSSSLNRPATGNRPETAPKPEKDKDKKRHSVFGGLFKKDKDKKDKKKDKH